MRTLPIALLTTGLVALVACAETASFPRAGPGDETNTTDRDPTVGKVDEPKAPSPSADAGAPDATKPAEHDPVVFVHGINGGSADFAVMMNRLVADGWPKDRLSAIDYPDPKWGCNTDNAETLRKHVEKVRFDAGAAKIDLVAHSMGTLSSRRFMKVLGGAAVVSTYVTLGGMHHGIQSSCLNPLPVCVWQELCGSKPYLTELNTAPITPGPATWVSIFSRSDETVPDESAELPGAENIPFDGVDHAGPNGLLERAEVYAEVKRVLEYPNL
jgi:triacylglycerol lipase